MHCLRRMAHNPMHVSCMLDSRCGTADDTGAAHGGGIVNRARRLRAEIGTRIFVPESAAIESDTQIINAVPCYQVHYGLCAAEHSQYYDAALKLALFIERHSCDPVASVCLQYHMYAYEPTII